MVFGIMANLVGMPYPEAVLWADAHDRYTKGRWFTGETVVQRSSYAVGYNLATWCQSVDEPNTVSSMIRMLSRNQEDQPLRYDPHREDIGEIPEPVFPPVTNLLEAAAEGGKYDDCLSCGFRATDDDVWTDFSTQRWGDYSPPLHMRRR